MELIGTYCRQGEPDVYTFVFKPADPKTGEHPMLIMPDDGRWPYSTFLYGEYHPDGSNEHLGEHVLFHELGSLVMDHFWDYLGRLALQA